MQARGLSASAGGLGMVIGGLLVALGSVFPWADPLGADLNGVLVDTNRTLVLVSGVVTLVSGILFMSRRPRFKVMAVIGAGAALVSLVLLIAIPFELHARATKQIDLTAVLAWDYWLSLAGAFAGAGSSIVAYREKPRAVAPMTVAEPASQRVGRSIRTNYLIAPAIIYAIIITQTPFLLTIWYSLQKWNLLRPENSRFNGIQNYLDLFRPGSDFITALINTVVLTTSAVLISLVLGLLFAELVNHRFPGRGIVRTLLITPFLVMPVVGALAWKNMILDPNFGVVDWTIVSLGGPRIDWFAQYPLFSIILTVVWRWAPFMMLILLAGMQALSDEVREAGRVDGASSRQEFRYIVLPHLKPFMQLCILFGFIYTLAEFDSIAMTTQGGPGTATMNLPYLIYRTLFYGYNVGQAAAMGVVLVVVTLAFATYLIRLLGRLMEGSQA